jgi:hypothetical protein
VTLKPPAVLVGKALAAKVRAGKVKRLKVLVKATDASGKTTKVTLDLKPSS